MLVILIFILFCMLDAARRQRKSILALKYQYRFFALRDELREYAMENPETGKNWVFQYLDSTMARTIQGLPEINIFYLLGLWLTHKSDHRLKMAKKNLEREYLKPKNRVHKEFEERFLTMLSEYVLACHLDLFVMAAVAIVIPRAIKATMRRIKRQALELAIEAPETSTLYTFAPSH